MRLNAPDEPSIAAALGDCGISSDISSSVEMDWPDGGHVGGDVIRLGAVDHVTVRTSAAASPPDSTLIKAHPSFLLQKNSNVILQLGIQHCTTSFLFQMASAIVSVSWRFWRWSYFSVHDCRW